MKKKLLVVSGDSATQNQICQALSDGQTQAFAASDGASLAFQLCLVQPDLIILDPTELGVEGKQMLCQIREKSLAPVIVLDAQDDPEAKIQALDCGADLCLTKPFDPRELQARVGALLRRAQFSNRMERQVAPLPIS